MGIRLYHLNLQKHIVVRLFGTFVEPKDFFSSGQCFPPEIPVFLENDTGT